MDTRKLCGFFLFVGFLGPILPNHSIVAQPTPDPDAEISLDELVDQSKGLDGGSSIDDVANSFTTDDITHRGTSSVYIKPNVNNSGCSDITECAVESLVRHEPGTKRIPWQAMQPPMNRAVVDRLNDPNSVKIVTDNINSVSFLDKLTLRLAEPTVGVTVDSAILEAEVHTSNSLNADMHLLKVAERYPASSPFVEGYFHCVQNQMSKALPMGLSQAQAFCRMDRTTASLDITGGGQSLPGLIHHPGWDIRDGGVGDRITLVDLIFNEESKVDLDVTSSVTIPGIGAYNLNPINPLDYTDQLATDFAIYYGDVEYSHPHSAEEWLAIYAGQKGLEAQYKIINPRIDVAYEYSFLTHTIFDYLRFVMYWYCQYLGTRDVVVPGDDVESGAFENFFSFASDPTELKPYMAFSLTIPSDPFGPPVLPQLGVEVNIEILGETGLDNLSTPGFPFPPVWISILGSEIEKFPENPVAGPGLPKYDCRPLEKPVLSVLNPTQQILYPGVTPTPLEHWINGYPPTAWPAPAGVYPVLSDTAGIRHYHNGTVPELYGMMFFLSRRIALGQILSRAKIARDVISELSASLGSTVPNAMINDAYKLIARATGVEVFAIEDAIASNVQDLIDYSIGAFMRKQEENSRAQSSGAT